MGCKTIVRKVDATKSMSRKLALNYESAQVEPKVMELFRFADKLTRHPAAIEKSDVERLREAGWTSEAILETVLVVSLYACANRFSAGRPRRRLLAKRSPTPPKGLHAAPHYLWSGYRAVIP